MQLAKTAPEHYPYSLQMWCYARVHCVQFDGALFFFKYINDLYLL